jgi:hypothetical protein
MKKAEQYTNSGPWRASRGVKAFMKWLVKRARRRAERRDPENVPARFTKGWY